MREKANIKVIDFHTHLMSLAGAEQVFPEARQSAFFKHVVPLVEPIADLTEGLHDRLLRNLAMRYNNKLSRLIYSHCGELFLMEALRLFKRHGLERLVFNMDKLGIERSVIYSLEPLTKTQEILEQVRPFADRFSVFASVHAQEADKVGYLKPLLEDGKASGLKIHPMIGGYNASNLYEKAADIFSLAQDYDVPLAMHTGDIPIQRITTSQVSCCGIPAIEALVRDFPKCKLVLNHLGWESWRAVIKLAEEHPNVYVETSWQHAGIMRRAVKALGPERVIFGSDYPLFQQWQALREVRRALKPRDFQLVAHDNAAKLLKLPSSEKQAVHA